MSPPPFLTGSGPEIKAFLDRFDTFLLDCDGVIWSGSLLLPHTVETIEHLKEEGKQIIFVTNNSTKSRAEHCLHFQKMGIPVREDEIFTSAYSSALYVSRILKLHAPRNKVFVLGEEGIGAELASEGVEYIGGSDPNYQRDVTAADFEEIASGKGLDPTVGAVVVGMDMKFNYLKLCYAAQYIARGAIFLATSTDSTYPALGTLFPGAGCISGALVPMIGREPLSLGKPSHAMISAIQSRYSLNLKRCCMVGDRLDTDIRMGIDGGLGGTLLVLSGVSKKEDLDTGDPKCMPDAYIDQLSDLLPFQRPQGEVWKTLSLASTASA